MASKILFSFAIRWLRPNKSPFFYAVWLFRNCDIDIMYIYGNKTLRNTISVFVSFQTERVSTECTRWASISFSITNVIALSIASVHIEFLVIEFSFLLHQVTLGRDGFLWLGVIMGLKSSLFHLKFNLQTGWGKLWSSE